MTGILVIGEPSILVLKLPTLIKQPLPSCKTGLGCNGGTWDKFLSGTPSMLV